MTSRTVRLGAMLAAASAALLGLASPTVAHPLLERPSAVRASLNAIRPGLGLAPVGGAIPRTGTEVASNSKTRESVVAASEAALSTPCGFPGACESTDPTYRVYYVSSGDSTKCTFEIQITWGDSTGETVVRSGAPDGVLVLIASHVYGAPRDYSISISGKVNSGSCTTTSGTGQFTLVRGGPSPQAQGGPENPSQHRTTCSVAHPVNCATGTFWHTFTDASVPGLGSPLDLTRTYSSQGAATNGPFGYGWRDSYGMRLSFDEHGNATVTQENGSAVTFWDLAGTYFAAAGVLGSLVKNGDGTYTFTRDATNTRYVFNSVGLLVKELTRDGYATTLSYAGNDLTKVTDQAGRSLTLTYGGGHIVSVSDPTGRSTSYSYDASGNLVGAIDPLGRGWTFTYDAQHLLLTMTDPKGGTTSSAYDGTGRVIEQVDPVGRATTWSYTGEAASPSGGTTTITDARGLKTEHHYVNLELVSVTAGAGTPQAATTSCEYDMATLGQSKVTDPDGHITTNTFDGRGDVLTTTDPLGHTTKYTYDAEGDLLTATDRLGVATAYTYDAAGNMLTSSTPLSGGGAAKWSYTYGAGAQAGDRLSATDPDGKVTSYVFDAAGDQTSVTDPLANKTTMTYDADGRMLTLTSPNGGTTTNVYDAVGELTKATDPLGHATAYGYDANGNATSVTDANGHTTAYIYNADNARTQTTQPDGATAQTGYDGDGNTVSQTDGNGHVTSYSYNSLNEITGTTDPDGHTTKYSYDSVGNLVTAVNPSGQTTTYVYDADRRTTEITYSDGKTHAVNESYDADGRRVSLTDGTGTSTFAYDTLGRLTGEINGAGAKSSYIYDPAGNTTQITYPNGKAISRVYDGDNRLTESTDWLGKTTTFSYDANSNLTTEHMPGSVTTQSAYDAANQLTGITDSDAGGHLAAFAYTRDGLGQVNNTTRTGAVAGTNSYGYDSQNRLTSDNTTTYAYDAANNPTSFNGQPQQFDAANQLLARGSVGGGEPASGGGEPGGGGQQGSGGTLGFHEPVLPTVTVVASTKTHTVTRRGKLSTPSLSTDSANELLLAFVSAQGPKRGQRVRGLSGGGLRWSRVVEATSPRGTSSIWQARASSPLSRARFTAALAKSRYKGMMDVVAFAPGATVGAVAKRSGARTAPSLTLNGSATAMILAVAHDSGGSRPRNALVGNQINDQALGGRSGGSSWALSAKGGTRVIGLGGPKSATWSLAAVAVLPGASAARVPAARGLGVAGSSSSATGATSPAATPSAGEATYQYDAQGDRTVVTTAAGTTTLSYDQAGRLTSVGENAQYSYDGDGLRASKTVSGATTAFVWYESHGLPLLLQDGSTSYIYGPAGQPVEQITGATATYLLGDQQGSTRLLTNSVGGVVGTYTYDAWGNVTSHTGEVGTNLQYDGQYSDAETGYQYLRARFYDPATGQFLTRDPLAALTRSPYSFAAGDPVNAMDPTGMLGLPPPFLVRQAVMGYVEALDRWLDDIAKQGPRWELFAGGVRAVSAWGNIGGGLGELTAGALSPVVGAGLWGWSEAARRWFGAPELAYYLDGAADFVTESGPALRETGWQDLLKGLKDSVKAGGELWEGYVLSTDCQSPTPAGTWTPVGIGLPE